MRGATTREYSVYAMTLDPGNPAPWQWDQWRAVAPALDPLFSDKTTAVRSFQNDDGKNRPAKTGGHTVLGGYVKFGALRWNETSHQKWTHGSPTTQSASDAWRFFSTDFSRPSLRTFDKTRVPPNIYGKLSGSRDVFAPSGTWVTLPSSFFVAVALDDERSSGLDIAMRDVARVWKPMCLARCRRAWATDASTTLPALPSGFAVTASMQDCAFAPSLERAQVEGWEIVTE